MGVKTHVWETAVKLGPMGRRTAWDTPSGVCAGPSSLRVGELGVEQACGPSPREALDAAGAWAASRTSRAWAAPVSCLVRFSLLHEVSDSPFSPPTLFFFFLLLSVWILHRNALG